jgi:hypothetical protein
LNIKKKKKKIPVVRDAGMLLVLLNGKRVVLQVASGKQQGASVIEDSPPFVNIIKRITNNS